MKTEEVIAWFEYEKENCEAFSISRPNKRIDAYEMALEALNQALKQPELIRCKDCKYCVDYGMGGYYCESEDIVPVGNYVEPDGFCNFARRRE